MKGDSNHRVAFFYGRGIITFSAAHTLVQNGQGRE